MKTISNQKVVYLSISDFSWDSSNKHKEGKLALKDVTHKDFDQAAKNSIRVADIAILTYGTDKYVIKTTINMY